MDPRTHQLLHGPIAPTLIRLAIPSTLIIVAQLIAGLAETWWVSRLGTEALAAMALVFPVLMLCQMMSSGAMGGGISSAVARALGAGDVQQARVLFFHAMAIAVVMGAIFTLVVVGGVWDLVSFHSFHDHGWIPVTVACGAVALLLVAAAGWIGTSRGRTTRRMLEGGGRMTAPGALLAKTPRQASKTKDITGGLPRVAELFEAR